MEMPAEARQEELRDREGQHCMEMPAEAWQEELRDGERSPDSKEVVFTTALSTALTLRS